MLHRFGYGVLDAGTDHSVRLVGNITLKYEDTVQNLDTDRRAHLRTCGTCNFERVFEEYFNIKRLFTYRTVEH